MLEFKLSEYFSGQEYSGMKRCSFMLPAGCCRKWWSCSFPQAPLCLWAECSYCIPLTLQLSNHVMSQCRKLTRWKINLGGAGGENKQIFRFCIKSWNSFKCKFGWALVQGRGNEVGGTVPSFLKVLAQISITAQATPNVVFLIAFYVRQRKQLKREAFLDINLTNSLKTVKYKSGR